MVPGNCKFFFLTVFFRLDRTHMTVFGVYTNVNNFVQLGVLTLAITVVVVCRRSGESHSCEDRDNSGHDEQPEQGRRIKLAQQPKHSQNKHFA
jgi:hypothetical protein